MSSNHIVFKGVQSYMEALLKLKPHEGKLVSHHGNEIVNLICVSVRAQAVPDKRMIWLPAQHIHTACFCTSYQGVASSGARKDLKEHNRNYFRHASWRFVYELAHMHVSLSGSI